MMISMKLKTQNGIQMNLLKKKKEAASYLHMAYELDGDAIFEDEDPVFIQLAKKQFLDLI